MECKLKSVKNYRMGLVNKFFSKITDGNISFYPNLCPTEPIERYRSSLLQCDMHTTDVFDLIIKQSAATTIFPQNMKLFIRVVKE